MGTPSVEKCDFELNVPPPDLPLVGDKKRSFFLCGKDMMRSKPYICAGLLAALSLPAAAADLTLVHEGQSNYVIVVVEGAVSPERTAAKELQNHLLAVTGVLLPIVEQTEVPDGTL